ncbi:hypothetical protein ACFCP7_17485 [Paenibacillus elgii]
MKKTFLKVTASAVLTATLVSSAALVTPAHAATVSQEFSQVQVNKNLNSNVLTNISTMSAYITTGEDGLLHVDQNAVNVVGKETFDVYARGVASLNAAINSGDIKVSNGTLQVDKSQLSNPSAPQMISPTAYGNFYWWGYALTLTDQESKQLAFNLRNAATTMAAAAAISGLIPAPPTQLVRAITYVLAAGTHTVANDISFKNNGNGVTINIHYALYFTINPN